MNICNGNIMAEFINGIGTEVSYDGSAWRVDANSGAIIIEDITPHIGDTISKGTTIQEVFNKLFTSILPRIPIISHSTMFKTNDNGKDPEYTEIEGLRPNAIYIRFIFEGSGQPMYISCWLLQSEIERLDTIVASKSSQAELDSLKVIVEQKASLLQLALLQEEIDNKIDKSQLVEIQTLIDKKANKDDLSKLESTLYDKADKKDVIILQNDVDELKETLGDFVGEDIITDIANDIDSLYAGLETKANKEDINNISVELSKKASQESLDALEEKVDAIKETNIDEVLSDINELNKTISGLENKVTTNTESIKKKADLTYVETVDNELKKLTTKLDVVVETKADKTELASKANYTDLVAIQNLVIGTNETVKGLKISVNNKADKTYVDRQDQDVRNDMQHKINELQLVHKNDINSSKSQISDIEKIIGIDDPSVKNAYRKTSITDKLEETYDMASKEWIQILTPEQYKRIPASRIDPAKLYMCVKYNKPYALYIGSVLIAERSSSTVTGFAYPFPLTF